MDEIEKTLSEPFSVETHKRVFTDYLEVVIDRDGVVHYAVPSHQEKILQIMMKELNMGREEVIKYLNQLELDAPTKDWYYILTSASGCVMVWTHFKSSGMSNDKQKETLRLLQKEGLYYGAVI